MGTPLGTHENRHGWQRGVSSVLGAPPPPVTLIGAGEAESNRPPPPLGPSNPAPTWHVPLPVLSGPSLEAASRGGFQPFQGRRSSTYATPGAGSRSTRLK